MLNLLNMLTGSIIIYALLVFVFFSYGIVSLLTWSPIKPLKYLGYPVILIGILSLCLRTAFVINPHDMSYNSLARLVASKGESIFLKYGITLLVIGIIMLGIYYLITFLKIKNRKESGAKQNEELA